MKVVCSGEATALAFEEPERVLRAFEIDDVTQMLMIADTARAEGKYVAGFVSYEAGAALVPRQRRPEPSALPLVELGIFATPAIAHTASTASDARAFAIGPLVPLVSSTGYARSVDAILARIREGDVYQVNLAVPFAFAFSGDSAALYARLADGGTPPFSAYVETERHALVSCSPELFVRLSRPVAGRATRLETRPMKGTAPLHDAPALANAKNRAEHVMIVDLLRNDLHRLSEHVEVEKLFTLEEHATYAATTSMLAAYRASGFALADVFAAMFPCGSITGAPKVAAMNAIAELEGPRGVFCGSIGYLAPDGSGTWNVAIRTATVDRATGRGTVHVGGGIVADSNARDEWAEILVKRRFIDRIAPPLGLIETMRRNSDGAYARIDAHLARLAGAADALHIRYDERAVRTHLNEIDVPGRPVLVRLEIDAAGVVTTALRELEERANATLVWSTRRVDERDPLQRYKTTWRPQYDAASREAAACGAFEALLLSREGAVADGSRTNVFVELGGGSTLLTPPLADGALPGILRAELIAGGRAREGRLTCEDLERADVLYVGNSARGLMRATFLRRTPDRARTR